MKRLLMSAVVAGMFLIGGTSAIYAQEHGNEVQINQMQQQKEFKQIKLNEVPQAVKDSVAEDYEKASIEKAYVNSDDLYKLELKTEITTKTVYYDKKGKEVDYDESNK